MPQPVNNEELRLINKLEDLTKHGKAVWLREILSYNKIFCVFEEDILEFKTFGASDIALANVDDALIVTANYRNVKFSWYVQQEDNWRRLIDLLKGSIVDLQRLEKIRTSLKKRLVE
ncbi:hypothetical protein BTA51_28585 [Hahella sp. CCB-MM4]|uniref:hypothetical protein n=1 Tax=Hahella sp. (strain CCB-MM4) TaxID=1926491 RepID=UPI000B9BD2FF|nr:hypothetical protein [Hahella sp. CCB-MM4]OZG69940.1 hypothetical protein BTA51_28585 [Hahella sp. CCB-MM4]